MGDKGSKDDWTPSGVGERIVAVIQNGDSTELKALKEGLDRPIAETESEEEADTEGKV